MPKVMPELTKKWVEALRSGEYNQGRRVLRNGNDSFCCLGVACDVVSPESWTKPEKYTCNYFIWFPMGILNNPYSYPGDICHMLGRLNDEMLGMLGINRTQEDKLIDMNDNGKTFEEIADTIEGFFSVG